jgi:predicted lysophospholipase L1 biosynthesis ABC-type transport system permease subunit
VTGGVSFDVRAMFAAAIAGVGIATVSALLPAIRAANGKAPASALPRRIAEKKTDVLLLYAGITIAVFGVVLSRLGLAGAWWDPSLLAACAFLVAALLCVPAALRGIATVASRQASPALPSVRFATAHLAATPRAAAVIVAALVAAIAMLVTASVVVASYREAVVTWAATTLPADLVVRPNDGLADGGDVRFTQRDLQRMRSTPGVADVRDLDLAAAQGQDSVAITAGDGVDLIALRARLIESVSPTLVRVTATRELRSQIVSIFERTFTIAFGLCIVALFVAIAGMGNALAASVLERTLEIGLLRYLGLRRASVERMIVVEAGVIGVVACAAGVALGSIISATIVAGAKLGGEAPIGTIFPLGQMLPIAGIALAAILIAGIHPGHVASRIRTERVLTVD